ncbi:hypothetical protein KKE60_06525 [Patescibacteria group bacterium]|nr:hypothetical protein [Patescibacteria group bacterium]
MTEQIYIATIENEDGIKIYASKSVLGLNMQIAKYCLAFWRSEYPDSALPNDLSIIKFYFAFLNDETLTRFYNVKLLD